MKILCISDYVDQIIYSINIKKRFKDIDLILSSGDLPMYYLEFITSSLNKPLYFVFGNHNLDDMDFFNSKNINNFFQYKNSFGSLCLEDKSYNIKDSKHVKFFKKEIEFKNLFLKLKYDFFDLFKKK